MLCVKKIMFSNSAIWKGGVCDTRFERKVNEICKIPSTLELCSTRTIANLFPNSLQMLCSQIANRIHEQILEMSFNCHRMAFNWHRMAFNWHIDRPRLQFCKKSTHKGAITMVLQFEFSKRHLLMKSSFTWWSSLPKDFSAKSWKVNDSNLNPHYHVIHILLLITNVTMFIPPPAPS